MNPLWALALFVLAALPAGAETMAEDAAAITALSRSAGPGQPLDPPVQGALYSETEVWLSECQLTFQHRLWVSEGSYPLILAKADLAQIGLIEATPGMSGVRLTSDIQTAIKQTLTFAKPAPSHAEYLAQPIAAMDHSDRKGPFLMIVLFDTGFASAVQARDLAAALARYRDTWCALTG